MKKFVFLIMILALMPFMVNAADKTIFSLTQATGTKDQTVSIYLKVNNSPSFGMLGIKVSYNQDILNYENAEFVNLQNAFMKDIVHNAGVITIYALSLENDMKVDDNFVKMDFKIKDDKNEKTDIIINVTDYGIDELTPLEYKVENGMINITSDKEEESKDNDENILSDEQKKDKNDLDSESNKSNSDDVNDNLPEQEKNDKKQEKNEDITGTKSKTAMKNNKMIIIGIILLIGILGILFIVNRKKIK